MSSSRHQGLRRVVLATGNILEIEDLIRKAGQTTIEELRGSIKTTLNNWRGWEHEEEGLSVLTIQPEATKSCDSPAPDTSGNKTTVKLFLSNNDADQVEDALKTMSSNLHLPCLDSVIITPPDVSDDVTRGDLEPVWSALEAAVERGAVKSIGLADVSPALFTDIYEWAKVKPSTVQVNLSSCCVVPKELTTFAQKNDVQVLTHNDPAEIVDEDIVSTMTSRLELDGAQIEWIARHRTIQVCFGLVKEKGYTICLSCQG